MKNIAENINDRLRENIYLHAEKDLSGTQGAFAKSRCCLYWPLMVTVHARLDLSIKQKLVNDIL